MITDFYEIKNEKDRELYVQFRNVLDEFFTLRLKAHEGKGHPFYECDQVIIEDLDKQFLPKLYEQRKETNIPEIDIIEEWIMFNEELFLQHLCALVVVYKEYNKRKQ